MLLLVFGCRRLFAQTRNAVLVLGTWLWLEEMFWLASLVCGDIALLSILASFLGKKVRMLLETRHVRCTERERDNGQSGASLLHACVTDFAASREHTVELKNLAMDRLSIAEVGDQNMSSDRSYVSMYLVYEYPIKAVSCTGCDYLFVSMTMWLRFLSCLVKVR